MKNSLPATQKKSGITEDYELCIHGLGALSYHVIAVVVVLAVVVVAVVVVAAAVVVVVVVVSYLASPSSDHVF